jgi:hypothetical protein
MRPTIDYDRYAQYQHGDPRNAFSCGQNPGGVHYVNDVHGISSTKDPHDRVDQVRRKATSIPWRERRSATWDVINTVLTESLP